MIDTIGLADLVVRAVDWASKVAAERRSRSEKRAANLVRDAGILTAAVQVLINDTYSLIGALGRFDTQWTEEQRQQLYYRVNDYMRQYKTLPYIHTYVAALETWTPPDLDRVATWEARQAVQDLVQWGRYIAQQDRFNKQAYFVLGDLPRFWSELKEAHSLEDLDGLAGWARSFDAWSGDHLRYVNEAFGRLSAAVLHKHPGIPPPTWTQHVLAGGVSK